ncbi:unnamed protein product [Camellia sinensis]
MIESNELLRRPPSSATLSVASYILFFTTPNEFETRPNQKLSGFQTRNCVVQRVFEANCEPEVPVAVRW